MRGVTAFSSKSSKKSIGFGEINNLSLFDVDALKIILREGEKKS